MACRQQVSVTLSGSERLVLNNCRQLTGSTYGVQESERKRWEGSYGLLLGSLLILAMTAVGCGSCDKCRHSTA
jgi:hypothetical protein